MKLKCCKCQYEWTPKVAKPKECPACKSRNWDKPELCPSECLDCGWRGHIFRPEGLGDGITLTECPKCRKMRLAEVTFLGEFPQ
jgi:predicted Zn-ribbon and HTH transcriptional regulator